MFRQVITIILILCSIALATVSTTTNRISYSGDGSDTTFTFNFPIGDTSDLMVIVRTDSTGAEEIQTETTDYSLSATNNDYSSGGTVTFVTAPASGETVLLIRVTPHTQNADFDDSGVLRLETLEDELDKLTRIVIDHNEVLGRCLKYPSSDSVSISSSTDDSVSRASKYLYFGDDGAPAPASSVTPSTATVSAYMETVLDDTSAAAARVTLGTYDIYNVETYGATPDDDSDDSTAFQAAIDAAEASNGHGMVFIPEGVYNFSSALTCSSKVSMMGVGLASVLVPDLNATTDFITIGSTTDAKGQILWCNFSILNDTTDCCQYAMKVIYVNQSRFLNITIMCGAAEYGFWAYNCLGNWYDLNMAIASTDYDYDSHPDNGMKITAGHYTQSNITRLKLNAAGIKGYSLYWNEDEDDVNDNGGTTSIVEGLCEAQAAGESDPPMVYLEGLNRVKFENFHTENPRGKNLQAVNCRYLTFDNCRLLADEETDFDNCDNVSFTQCSLRNITTDANCDHFIFGAGCRQTDKQNNFKGSLDDKHHTWEHGWTFLTGDDYRSYMSWQDDQDNLFYNSNFERWTSTQPDGWDKDAAITWTKCGTGQADSNNHFTDYCAQIKSTTSGTDVEFTIPNANLVYEQLKGSYASFSMWFYVSSDDDVNTTSLTVTRSHTDSNHDGSDVLYVKDTQRDKWTYKQIGFECFSDLTSIAVTVSYRHDGTNTGMYIAEPCLRKNTTGPSGYVAANNEFDDYVVLSGNKIQFGSAAPTSGTYIQGDIVFNTGAAASGKVGWVCVTAGAPGTWKTFGVISN